MKLLKIMMMRQILWGRKVPVHNFFIYELAWKVESFIKIFLIWLMPNKENRKDLKTKSILTNISNLNLLNCFTYYFCKKLNIKYTDSCKARKTRIDSFRVSEWHKKFLMQWFIRWLPKFFRFSAMSHTN